MLNKPATAILLALLTLAVGAGFVILGFGSVMGACAEIAERLGHQELAKNLYRESARKSTGKQAVNSLIAVAQIEDASGEKERALTDFQNALSVAQDSKLDPLLMAALNSQVGRLRYNLGDAAAVGDLERAVLLREQKQGPNNIDNYRDLYRIATIQQAQEQYTESIDSFERRINIANANKMGDDEVANNLLEIGKCYGFAGNNEKAAKKCSEAVELLREHFGATHPRVVTAQLQLAVYQQQLGFDDLARNAVTLASENQATREGGLLLVKLATRFAGERQFDDAKKTFALALKAAREDQDTKLEGLCLADLAAVSAMSGDFDSAKRFSQEAVSKYQSQFGNDAKETAEARAAYKNVCELAEKHATSAKLE
jgi:tetratricopeptide (TPR) repeat protein